MQKDIINRLSFLFLLFASFFAFADGVQLPDDHSNDGSFDYTITFGSDGAWKPICFQLDKGGSYNVFWELFVLRDTSQSCNCHTSSDYYCTVEDTLGYTYADNNSAVNYTGFHHRYFFNTGVHNISFHVRGSGFPHQDWAGYFLGYRFHIIFTRQGVCPNSDCCNKTTCDICKHEYCAIHDNHYTSLFIHSQLQGHEHDNTTHYHCSNSQALLQQWSNQIVGICNVCGQSYCKICGHTCGVQNGSCPNLPQCQSATCDICGGSYCSTHNFHLCSGYTDYSSGFTQAPFTVQTTVQGSAVVTVNVQTNTDVSDLKSNTDTLVLNSNEALLRLLTLNNELTNVKLKANDIDQHIRDNGNLLGNIKTNLETTNSNLSGVNTKLSSGNDKLDTVNSRLSTLIDKVEDNGDTSSSINSTLSDIASDVDEINEHTQSNDHYLEEIAAFVGDSDIKLREIRDLLKTDRNNNPSGINARVPDLLSDDEIGEDDPNNPSDPNDPHGFNARFTSINTRLDTSLIGLKAKLIPSFSTASGSSVYTFQLPSLGSFELPQISIDLEDSRLSVLYAASRSICIFSYGFCFILAITKVLRQY